MKLQLIKLDQHYSYECIIYVICAFGRFTSNAVKLKRDLQNCRKKSRKKALTLTTVIRTTISENDFIVFSKFGELAAPYLNWSSYYIEFLNSAKKRNKRFETHILR